MSKTKIKELIRELKQEAWHEGHDKCFYDHSNGDCGHTVEQRKKYLNHKAIADKILLEINHLIEALP